jgi:error-prone DNA polymerase
MLPFAQLHSLSNFSFLRGASHGEELVLTAKALGWQALGLCDINTLAGVVRAHVAAKEHGLKLLVGCTLLLRDGRRFIIYPQNRAGYGRLSQLLTLGKRRAIKGGCDLGFEDVLAFAQDWQVILPFAGQSISEVQHIKDALSSDKHVHLSLGIGHCYSGEDRHTLAQAHHLSTHSGVPLAVCAEVRYHSSARRPLADVLTCIREHVTIAEAGYLLAANAEQHLKSPAELARLFKGYEAALAHTQNIADACSFSLDDLRYEYPDEPVPPGLSPQAHLEALTFTGAQNFYGKALPAKIRTALQRELELIKQLDYAPYFLTVHDIVHWARAQGILCQGRGSAANSAVCFCLGITAVNPAESDLLFDRFISPERKEPPDIDVDFEHERREEVIQYIYARYGRHRAGLAATVITYRPRSAIRDVGKVMGLSTDVTSALAGTVWGSWGRNIEETRVAEAGLDLSDPHLRRTLDLAQDLLGFPRHLSQHVGGFVLTRDALDAMVPIGNAAMPDRSFIEWDKDDIEALGLMKVDVLALGMLSCIRRCFDLIKTHHGEDWSLATIPREDPATYDMLCAADSIGVFQVESRAQMNMLPRLKPRTFYDLVIEVAIVRPGPIQGDMVHPYLRRRQGLEDVFFPAPSPDHGSPTELSDILGRTLGVPLFQEQAMKIAMVAAEFTPAEVNALRHAMATFRKRGTIGGMEEMLVSNMVARGYDPAFAARVFAQIKGFGEYGFPESHAASFALLVYVSAWLKCHYPAAFCAAILNAQPMGFYAPAQLVACARNHGVTVLPPAINISGWESDLENGPTGHAVRLGLRQVDGIGEEAANRITTHGPYASIEQLYARAKLSKGEMEKLCVADALHTLAPTRREALWQVKALKCSTALPLFDFDGERCADADVKLPDMALSEQVIEDYRSLRLSLRAHPLSFLREAYARQSIISCQQLATQKDGARVKVTGVVLVRQKPGSAKGVCFITIEDESGWAQIIVWPDMVERYRKVVMGAHLIEVDGRLQRTQGTAVPVIHVVAAKLIDRSADLAALSDTPLANQSLARADEVRRPVDEDQRITKARRAATGGRHPRDIRVIPKSRDFH